MDAKVSEGLSDLEATKLCAEAMGIKLGDVLANPSFDNETWIEWLVMENGEEDYWPLKDDAQAMALVKELELNIGPDVQGEPPIEGWEVSDYSGDKTIIFDANLNRAIVFCVAALQRERGK